MRLFYYLFLKPVSLLPLPVLYRLSDFLYFLGYRIIGYRTKVVWQNLKGAFPDKSDKELKTIMDGFYSHFCDLIVESVKQFSISKEEALRRCTVINPELIEQLYQKGKSIIAIAGHYNSWEFAAVSLGLNSNFRTVGIYHPFKNKFIDDQFIKSRGRYGMFLLPKQDTKTYFQESTDKIDAVMFGADQCPHNVRRAHWMYFLEQETPVMFGAEKFAKEYDYPVVFGHIRKIKRGYYEVEFELITDTPRELPHGAITEMHTYILEDDIKEAPQYWLWTHRRWKRERPADMPISAPRVTP